MSTILPPARGKSWVYQVTALCIFLGALLGLSLKTQRQVVKEGGVGNRLPALRETVRVLRQNNDALQKELADYKKRYEDLAMQQAEGMSSTQSLARALEEAKMLAGTVAVRGPGIIVTLQDSPQRDPTETRTDYIEQFVVHDSDIRAIVSELYAAGAETVAVNDQRLIANSAIRCVGPAILVNSVELAPPYKIKVIGRQDVLENALMLPGGVASELLTYEMIEIQKKSDILVPAYGGSTRFEKARVVPTKRRR